VVTVACAASTRSLTTLALAACLTLLSGCGEEGLFPTTVDPGPDYNIAELVWDESFFYCQVEPRAITAYGCATGDAGRGESGGGCHASVTSFRLFDYMPKVADSCEGNVVGPNTLVPADARQNYQSAQARMRRDPEVAPLLQRPLNRLKHPRAIFTDDSDGAAVIREWATYVTTQ
jgi:hypothetical protein